MSDITANVEFQDLTALIKGDNTDIPEACKHPGQGPVTFSKAFESGMLSDSSKQGSTWNKAETRKGQHSSFGIGGPQPLNVKCQLQGAIELSAPGLAGGGSRPPAPHSAPSVLVLLLQAPASCSHCHHVSDQTLLYFPLEPQAAQASRLVACSCPATQIWPSLAHPGCCQHPLVHHLLESQGSPDEPVPGQVA